MPAGDRGPAHAQNPDGSWGLQTAAGARIVATLFCVRSLVDAGFGVDLPAVADGLGFLESRAIDGGGTVDGTASGVLSCYTGILASTLIRGGRAERADRLIRWIVDYQPVVYADRVYLQPEREWGSYLKTRYGGCMAATTCITGIVHCATAVLDARDAGLEVDGGERLLDATRALLGDRLLIYRRAGGVIPLARKTGADPAGDRWLRPAMPRDHLPDLIDVLTLAGRLGVPSAAADSAAQLLDAMRLPSGEWPLLGRRPVRYGYRPEPVSRSRPSAWTTRRVIALTRSGLV